MLYLPTDTEVYIPTDYEMSAVRQHVKDVSVKVELLNYDPYIQMQDAGEIRSNKFGLTYRPVVVKGLVCRVSIVEDGEILRTVTLQIGDKVSQSAYTINGQLLTFDPMYEGAQVEVAYTCGKQEPWVVIDSLEGNLVSDSFSMDGDSIQRRNYSCTICVSDHARKVNKSSILSEYLVGNGNKIWIDKYIRVYYGIYSMRLKEIAWWRIGTFTYTTASYTFSATDCNLSLSCADIMCNYDGTKNGLIHQTKYDNQVTGESVVGFSIPAINYRKDANGVEIKDENGERIIESHNKIKDTIIGLLDMAGITDFYVEDYPSGDDEIPHDMDYNGEVVYTTLWNDIRDLYPSWEYFFDVNGKFIWRKIPTGYDERPIIDDSLIDDIYVTENLSNAFTGIYNCTEVWGKTFTLTNEDRYADSSTYANNVYTINLKLFEKTNSTLSTNDPMRYLVQNDKIAFRISNDNAAANPRLRIVGTINGTDTTVTLTDLPIVDSAGDPLDAGVLKSGKICVFTYRQNQGNTLTNCVYLNGQCQAYGYYEETNEDCPFSVPNLGYKIIKRITKETLFSDDLCYNQAEYETYKTCAMQDSINLTMIIVPWLEVNQKVEYTSKMTGGTQQYMIKNLSWSTLDGTMTVNMYKFREDFEYVYNRRNNG